MESYVIDSTKGMTTARIEKSLVQLNLSRVCASVCRPPAHADDLAFSNLRGIFEKRGQSDADPGPQEQGPGAELGDAHIPLPNEDLTPHHRRRT